MSMAEASIDPLAHFFQAIFRRDERKPVPLIATHIDVAIRGGLGFVTTQRTFRNTEKISIEATMTFPVPVDATLCVLTANIDGAVLHAVARARNKAAKTYEAAVISGKSAILHQELLKGVHMLSVGHVRPGGEIIVTDTWTAPLSFLDQTPRLRIPTTVGEIYGQSPLAPPNDLVTGGTIHEATVAISCNDGTVSLLNAGPMVDGRYRVTLDAPIDVVVSGWTARKLTGVAADGRQVVLHIAPAPAVEARLDIDLLFDHSGSMSGPATSYSELDATKFDVARVGLIAAIRHHLRSADRMRLWQFDDSVDYLGEASGEKCEALVGTVHDPRGGTEIGRAFDAVCAAGQRSGQPKNVVIITDGLSWALDPERLARTGMRVTVVLIGEDASEVAIGHLAGLTGGQVFSAVGSDAGGVIAAALDAARRPQRQPEMLPDKPRSVEVFRRGARIVAAWGAKGEGRPSLNARQIGASAAMLAIPLMNREAAALLAEAEGVVCHLTSLVLVDEAGGRYERLPATRKVELSTPRVASLDPHLENRACLAPVQDSGVFYSLRPRADAESVERPMSAPLEREERRCLQAERARVESAPAPAVFRPAQPSRAIRFAQFVGRIDWDADPEALRHGDLTRLPSAVQAAISWAAGLPEIVALARKLKVDPALVVIGLLARESRGQSRSAGRLASALIGRLSAKDIADAVACLGL
jgi:Vault protein inter-alpha-trypsin domain